VLQSTRATQLWSAEALNNSYFKASHYSSISHYSSFLPADSLELNAGYQMRTENPSGFVYALENSRVAMRQAYVTPRPWRRRANENRSVCLEWPTLERCSIEPSWWITPTLARALAFRFLPYLSYLKSPRCNLYCDLHLNQLCYLSLLRCKILATGCVR